MKKLNVNIAGLPFTLPVTVVQELLKDVTVEALGTAIKTVARLEKESEGKNAKATDSVQRTKTASGHFTTHAQPDFAPT